MVTSLVASEWMGAIPPARASETRLGYALCVCQVRVGTLIGQELLGRTLSPSRLQENTIHIAQYGRLSWLQRAGIFIWFTPDLQQPFDILKR